MESPCKHTYTHTHTHIYIYIYIYIYISSSSRATSTDIPDPLSPLLPIVLHFWQVLRAISCILSELLYVGLHWLPCFSLAMCGGGWGAHIYIYIYIHGKKILEETDCISYSTNTLGKGMNPISLSPAMGK